MSRLVPYPSITVIQEEPIKLFRLEKEYVADFHACAKKWNKDLRNTIGEEKRERRLSNYAQADDNVFVDQCGRECAPIYPGPSPDRAAVCRRHVFNNVGMVHEDSDSQEVFGAVRLGECGWCFASVSHGSGVLFAEGRAMRWNCIHVSPVAGAPASASLAEMGGDCGLSHTVPTNRARGRAGSGAERRQRRSVFPIYFTFAFSWSP